MRAGVAFSWESEVQHSGTSRVSTCEESDFRTVANGPRQGVLRVASVSQLHQETVNESYSSWDSGVFIR